MQMWHRVSLWSGLSRQLSRVVEHPWWEWSSLHQKIGLFCWRPGSLVDMGKLLSETPSSLTYGGTSKSCSSLSSPNHCHYPILTFCGSNIITLTSSPAPPAPCSTKTNLPHSSEKPWAGSGTVEWRQPSFDRRSTAHCEYRALSLLLTSYTKTLTCHF